MVGALALLRERQVARESGRAIWLKPIREDLLIVGSAPDGDAWAIDLRDGEAVGVISHDLVWDREVASARAGMIRVADSLDGARAGARRSVARRFLGGAAGPRVTQLPVDRPFVSHATGRANPWRAEAYAVQFRFSGGAYPDRAWVGLKVRFSARVLRKLDRWRAA